ncbi:MAG: hypothetical protein AAGI45_09170 [Cyanobacteria bacterium P01_H01_bin.26]
MLTVSQPAHPHLLPQRPGVASTDRRQQDFTKYFLRGFTQISGQFWSFQHQHSLIRLPN